MKTGYLSAPQKRSPLTEIMALRGGSEKKGVARKELAVALPLTSLIDAFSIIVIYLLIGTQTSGVETQINGKVNLPMADHSVGVEKEVSVLRVEKGNYYLNDQIIARASLSQKLAELKKQSAEKNNELMIQADTQMPFEELDPLLKAGSEAGIEKLKFAVVPTK